MAADPAGRGVKRPPSTPVLRQSTEGTSAPKLPKVERKIETSTRPQPKPVAPKSAPRSTTGGVPSASPNFANIYSFFAKMFDPQVKFDALEGIREASMSPLDKEVVKLLMSNLELNIANTAFRQQLLDAYRQQLQQSVHQTIAQT